MQGVCRKEVGSGKRGWAVQGVWERELGWCRVGRELGVVQTVWEKG